MTLIYLAVAWMLGLLVGDALPQQTWAFSGAAGCSLLLTIAVRRHARLRLALLCCMCLAFGALRLQAAEVPDTSYSIRRLNDGEELAFQGVILEDPQRNAEGQRALMTVEQVWIGARPVRAEGLVLVELPRYPERWYGDRLLLKGQFRTPPGPRRAGEFDYRRYLERKWIVSLSKPTESRLLARHAANPLVAALLDLRTQAQRVLLRCLPEPQAALAVGILLGLQSAIPDDVNETFSITGTSHILVISGWNITIIATALYSLAARFKLSQRAAFWPILACIWIYALFVGATATVLRAALMGSIVVIGKRLERSAHAWTTLFAACWLMTLWNPQAFWDMGFQLSALATASLFAYGKGTEALLLKTPLRAGWLDWAREALTATLAAQILALPLILYSFGNLSLIAPLANVAILPMVPYAMLFGALALVGGLCWLPLGQILALPAYLFLAWLTEGARLFAALPGAAVIIPPFPLWALLVYYALVVGAWLGWGRVHTVHP